MKSGFAPKAQELMESLKTWDRGESQKNQGELELRPHGVPVSRHGLLASPRLTDHRRLKEAISAIDEPVLKGRIACNTVHFERRARAHNRWKPVHRVPYINGRSAILIMIIEKL